MKKEDVVRVNRSMVDGILDDIQIADTTEDLQELTEQLLSATRDYIRSVRNSIDS